MKLSLAAVLTLALGGLATKPNERERMKQLQAEPNNVFATAWDGFSAWAEQAINDIKDGLEQLNFDDAGKWLAQAGGDVKNWSGKTGEHIRRELDGLAQTDVGKWLAKHGGDVTEWTAHSATTFKNNLDKVDLEKADRWLAKIGMDPQLKGTWDNVRAIKLEDVPEYVKNYIRDNPKQTTFYVIQGVLYFSSGVVWSPVLSLFGFKSKIVAGSAASFWQSTMGNKVARKGIFAYLQSAGAGGYGVSAMNMGTRGATGALSIADRAFKGFTGGGAVKNEVDADSKDDGHAVIRATDRYADEL